MQISITLKKQLTFCETHGHSITYHNCVSCRNCVAVCASLQTFLNYCSHQEDKWWMQSNSFFDTCIPELHFEEDLW